MPAQLQSGHLPRHRFMTVNEWVVQGAMRCVWTLVTVRRTSMQHIGVQVTWSDQNQTGYQQHIVWTFVHPETKVSQ